MIKKILLTIIIGMFLFSFISADQVLWDDDSDIKIYDTWADNVGMPLTGADCSWKVYNSDGTLNQAGTPSEFSVGIINFTVNRLDIGIYPMLINCTHRGFNGTSSKYSIKVVDELSEEYKDRLVEINETTKNIYDLLVDDMNVTLTSILNLTNLTYEGVLDIESDITDLNTCCNSLRTYLEDKWGSEDADDIVERLKDIRGDVTYLRSRYYYLTEKEKDNLLLSIRKDGQEALNLLYGKDKWWEKLLIWLIPIGVLIFIIIIVCLIKPKKQIKDFEGET